MTNLGDMTNATHLTPAQKFFTGLITDLETRAASATGTERARLERAAESYRNSEPMLALAKAQAKRAA